LAAAGKRIKEEPDVKVALVTGGAAGIGAAICRRLARDGIAVGVLDVLIDDARKVADEIGGTGGKALALQADITKREQVKAAVAQLRDAFGPVTILVNNAGITGLVAFEELTDAQWDRMFEVNMKGTFIVTQVAIPDMKAAGWGRIVNISSSSAQSGAPMMAHYSASKGAIIAFTKTLARELGPLGITANNIPPRFVMNTVMSEQHFKNPNQSREEWIKAGPIRRQGEPEDIAGACAYLVSDEAGYVTGQTIGVNGGRYI
jgi:2-hydroxycyclohexanecarboxyl-CoA dehydrogenase